MVKNELKEILTERGIKQKWLAEKAGVDQGTISLIVANKTNPNIETILRIAKVLNMQIEEFYKLNI